MSKTYLEEYENFWKEIVEVNGILDHNQVKKELSDFSAMISEVSKVYDHISHGRISKPLTHAHHLIAMYDDEISAIENRCCRGCDYFLQNAHNPKVMMCELDMWSDPDTVKVDSICCGTWEKKKKKK